MEEIQGADLEFSPRPYQIELFEHALKKNSILVLGTGSGKTFISILLIKELGDAIRGKLSEGAKRAVFVVNTVPLVYQQMEAISRHTPFTVGKYEGSMGVDFWSEDKWKEELDQYEVLVMVAEIFSNLIMHNRLPLRSVNLIIIDECHHATGKHPMKVIMDNYREMKVKFEVGNLGTRSTLVPRVMGLTACVIHKSCKTNQVLKYMKELEITMDCGLVTSEDQAMVQQYTTKPKEFIITYLPDKCIENYDALKRFLDNVNNIMLSSFDQYLSKISYRSHFQNMKDKFSKSIKKKLMGLENAFMELGYFVFKEAIDLECEALSESSLEADSLEEKLILQRFSLELQNSAKYLPEINRQTPLKYISSKVKRLYEMLGLMDCVEEVRILVFVQRRNTAKLLCYLHKEMCELCPDLNLNFLIPDSIVGQTTNMQNDLKVKLHLQKQKEVVKKFNKGDNNIVYSTSVLEEGIDIRKCNLVIRFDKPPNYRSYIQSLGRARAVPSKFIMFVKDEETDIQLEEVKKFKEINIHLTSLCRSDRPVPSLHELENSLLTDPEEDPPYTPYSDLTPRITFDSAVQVLNKYCGSLPHDIFTNLSVDVRFVKENEFSRAYLQLPLSSPLKCGVSGAAKSTRENAKKSAALEMCKRLHQINELDNHLLPRKTAIELDRCLSVELEKTEQGKPQPGTKKRRQIYDRRVCRNFKGSVERTWLLHSIDFYDTKSEMQRFPKRLGILCDKKHPTCPFPLYCSQRGKLVVHVTCSGQPYLDQVKLEQIKHFHFVCYQLLLSLHPGMFLFSLEDASKLLTVPLTVDGEIDYPFLEIMQDFVSLEENGKKQIKGKNSQFCRSDFEDALVSPIYRDPEFFIVEEVLSNLNPLSEFPDHKKKYNSFLEYYHIEYGLKVSNLTQPLLKCRHFPKELDKIKMKPSSSRLSKQSGHHPILVPELCYFLPLSASFWWQISMVPSVLHRLNGLLLEQELYFHISRGFSPDDYPYKANKEVMCLFWKTPLDYQWCENQIGSCIIDKADNLALVLENKIDCSIYPGMLLQALTSVSAGDNFDLERLEVLGDSFLKFIVGIHLFCEDKDKHEGHLTLMRSEIVSNKHLYTLGKMKELPSFYQGFVLNRSTIIPYGFEFVPEIEHTLLNEKVNSNQWLNYFQAEDPSKLERTEEVHHPWKQQLIPDKCVADCVEALIGVFLLTGGERAAIQFTDWLGLKGYSKKCKAPSTALLKTSDRNVDPAFVHSMWKRMCLDRLEALIGYTFKERSFLIEAVTHPSYTSNKVTNCYQRLEFLGDAVLDYLVTCHIYGQYLQYDPGQLTDLRSHYVKNETLARVAVSLGIYKYLQHMSLMLGTCIDQFIEMMSEGEQDFNTEDDTCEAEDIEVPKALGDIIEAIIGAVYIDSGMSLSVCWRIIKLFLKEEFEKTRNFIPINHVRAMYEAAQSLNLKVEKEIVAPVDKEPAKCTIKIDGMNPCIGTGKNTRTALQAAAKLALYHLQELLLKRD